MGNITAGPAEGRRGSQEFNIPPDVNIVANNDLNNPGFSNNPNRPVSSQMIDMVLQFAVPLLSLILIAMQEGEKRTRQKEREKLLELVASTQEKYQNELEKTKIQYSADLGEFEKRQETEKFKSIADVDFKEVLQVEGHRRRMKEIMMDELQRVEAQATYEEGQKLKELAKYEALVHRYLDIRCSVFKSRQGRMEIEQQALSLLDKEKVLQGVSVAEGLNQIFSHDYRFCARNPNKNGKLRFAYSKLWKTQIEKQKHEKILKELKNLTDFSFEKK
ncbi:coiled-coil domain-containing protein 127-like [Lingula anatina]|uniref:Coiled-coil domain-containing protein 127-like n=1 Tax=Lingula anatina TaxID=7574 RepID=A0A1S3JPL2_LINAN|nr:coiled-coil domain-containing protein 127-like [Lingula anatina]XP_013412298.1 coiled-coil domain-containing protein 127-like [Lingula anatina]|eukprot:XP_013412297.1 coiled-coil domain-containing protein 127-like [Lingula anatina]